MKPVPFTPSCIFLAADASVQSLPRFPNSRLNHPSQHCTGMCWVAFFVSRGLPCLEAEGLWRFIWFPFVQHSLRRKRKERHCCCSVKNSRAGAPSLAEGHFPEPHCCTLVTNGPFWHIPDGSKEPGGGQDAHCPAQLQAVHRVCFPSRVSS